MAKKTHLYEWHVERARMGEFAGFSMPLWYEGIIPEHLAVRNAVGVFDVTHMGRCLVEGKDALPFLNYVTTNNVRRLKDFQVQYTLFCNPSGGIKDDLTICRLSEEKFLLVYNASNREKDFNWLRENSRSFDVQLRDISDEAPMIAVQGPYAVKVLEKALKKDLATVRRFRGLLFKHEGREVLVTRTGYTGEDGFELILFDVPLEEPDPVLQLWNSMLEAGKEFGIKPCGLGARDSLRLEAGMCLYGNDITEETNPIEADLKFVVKLKKGDFIGRDAILKVLEEGIKRKRVGIEMVDKGIPRHGQAIWSDGEEIGFVTSGTYSPILRKGIGMGYVSIEYAKEGQDVYVAMKNRKAKAKVVRWPFYDESRYGWKRTTE